MAENDTNSAPASKPKLAHPLPTGRLAFAKHLELLRGYAVAGADGRGVQNKQLADLTGISHKTSSLANAFFFDVGFIRRTEAGVLPAPEVIAFQQAFQWNPDRAAWELAPLIEKSWFAKALLPQLLMGPVTEDEAVFKLGRAIGAGPNVRAELKMLLDYLEVANLIMRDGGMIQNGREVAPDRGRDTAPVHKPDAPPHPTTPVGASIPTSAVLSSTPRAPLPLLIQGLLEQLPKDGRWTREKADQWLDMARMSFEIVYEFDPPPTSFQPATEDP